MEIIEKQDFRTVSAEVGLAILRILLSTKTTPTILATAPAYPQNSAPSAIMRNPSRPFLFFFPCGGNFHNRRLYFAYLWL
jgi:hypothetical protein